MQYSNTLSVISTLLFSAAKLSSAADMSQYDPQAGVQPEFEAFLKTMVTAAEDPAVTTGYTDYFVADGMQTTLTIHCVGASAIQKCKESFLVNDRSIVHFPNTTSVVTNNETATVYESLGRIEQTYPAPISNCSQLYYRTQYTVLKTEKTVDAAPNLATTPQQQLYWYHDVEVNPAALISDIPCDSQKVKARQWVS